MFEWIQNITSKERLSGFIAEFLLIFIILFLVFSGLFAFWFSFQVDETKQHKIESEQLMLSSHKSYLESELATIFEDLTILRSLPQISDNSPSSVVDEVAKTYETFVNSRQVYDQIRFIDFHGHELIRINKTPDGAYRVPKNKLQNKSNRYYFQEAKTLKANQGYLSRLDLNIERGLIEVPLKPMLRAALPVFSDDGASFQGIVIVNYLADNLLNLLKHPENHGTMHVPIEMLDTSGYWLFSVDKSREWGFMYDHGQSNTMTAIQPNLWRQVMSQSDGSVAMPDGSYQFLHIDLYTKHFDNLGNHHNEMQIITSPKAGQNYSWVLMNFLPKASFSEPVWELVRKSWPYYLFGFLALIALAFFMTYFRQQQTAIFERARYMAYHDGLTDLLNRSAWKHQILPELKGYIQDQQPFAIAFIDLNKFKPINDEYGHEVGDEVLKIVGKRLQAAVRHGDFVVRQGGDEFVVVFRHTNDSVNKSFLVNKLMQAFAKPLMLAHHQLNVSASIGAAIFPVDGDNLQSLINIADKEMYQDKESQRISNKATILLNEEDEHPSEAV